MIFGLISAYAGMVLNVGVDFRAMPAAFVVMVIVEMTVLFIAVLMFRRSGNDQIYTV